MIHDTTDTYAVLKVHCRKYVTAYNIVDTVYTYTVITSNARHGNTESETVNTPLHKQFDG